MILAADREVHQDFDVLTEKVNDVDLLRERRWKERADAARFTFWIGVALIGAFLVPVVNLVPISIRELSWQLNVISTLMSNGMWALLGALLICLSRVLNQTDRMIRNRALLVRNIASWVALGWLLLIPLQLFLSVRLINSLSAREIGEIQNVQRVSRQVSSATSENELRAAMARIPNQPPMPRLTVPIEVAKTNLLSQLQSNLNAARNRQEQRASARWQTWLREAFRNTLQCGVLAVGFLAIGKKRNIPLPD
ncbi:MAG: hypothetical protein RLZZ117_2676 [Cyanobacteriota bacterium]